MSAPDWVLRTPPPLVGRLARRPRPNPARPSTAATVVNSTRRRPFAVVAATGGAFCRLNRQGGESPAASVSARGCSRVSVRMGVSRGSHGRPQPQACCTPCSSPPCGWRGPGGGSAGRQWPHWRFMPCSWAAPRRHRRGSCTAAGSAEAPAGSPARRGTSDVRSREDLGTPAPGLCRQLRPPLPRGAGARALLPAGSQRRLIRHSGPPQPCDAI